MRILIKDLTFKTIVGILEEERHTPQRVIVHATLDYDYSGDNFIDYAKVSTFLEDEMNKMSYYLLEDALSDLSQKLKVFYPQIDKMNSKFSNLIFCQMRWLGFPKPLATPKIKI